MLSSSVWLPWSEWSNCSSQCGIGEITRERNCSVPGACEGRTKNQEDCVRSLCGGKIPFTLWLKTKHHLYLTHFNQCCIKN